ncbi:MAG: hypothetical protein JXM70_08430 [Pirellulales bacterium]|nr:hypothetical protein [Pirellulales bacterium]
MKLQAISVLLAGLVLMAGGCGDISSKQPGMVVVYALDEDKQSGVDKPSEQDMQRLVAMIDNRLNPNWSKAGSVRLLDNKRIEVTIFRTDLEKMQRIADLLPKYGTLEFRILANSRDHADLISLAKASKDNKVYQHDKKKKARKSSWPDGCRSRTVAKMNSPSSGISPPAHSQSKAKPLWRSLLSWIPSTSRARTLPVAPPGSTKETGRA